MRLIANWPAVLRHAWSVRLLAISTLLGALELGLPYLNGVLPIHQGTFAVLVIVTNLAATIARIVNQRTIPTAGDNLDAHYGEQP